MLKKHKKIIIVGQGISGTMLSWFFDKAGIDFIIIDDGLENTPSKTAAGIINPVTGRRVVTVWMDDVILPFAEKTYNDLSSFLDHKIISKTEIIDFFPNPFMKESFLKRINQQANYISLMQDENDLNNYFNYEFGIGVINPVYLVHLQQLLLSWRNYLLSKQKLINESFNFSNLSVTNDEIVYNDIKADAIIFCDGLKGAHNPYFSLLPFALNKGEAIIIEAPDLPTNHIYKKSVTLAPFDEPNIFWAGSNYLWNFDDDFPTEDFRKATEQSLKTWLKVPFKIIDHKVAIRPATVERRPFVGFHPTYKNMGIINGMGTKGCSLAPYFAHQLTENIIHNQPIETEADISRHARILKRASL